MKLLFATSNQGKFKEVRQILADLPVEILSLTDFPELKDLEVVEAGQAFTANAAIKAKFFAEKTGLLTAADDSGLEVDILGGQPGVHSARWVAGSDQDRNQALLGKLKNVQARTAKFVCAVCLYDPKKQSSQCFEGEVKGQVADQAAGDQGFGYDPIFIPDGYEKTFGELGTAVKNKLSHRKKALEQLKQYLLKPQ